VSTETDPRTDEQLAADPQAFDAKLTGLYEAWQKASDARDRAWSQIHEAAGDRRDYRGRGRAWGRTHSEVEQTVRQMAAHGEPLPLGMNRRLTAGDLLVAEIEAESALASAMLAVQAMEAIYRTAPWQRFFPCTNRDGHIHATYRDCSSVGWDTPMAWRPDLSGLTVDEAVAKLGPALCSICFPLAPVEQKSMTLGQVEQERTRAEREAAAAARQAKKDAKELTGAEQFRTAGQYSDRVTTVARCKEIIRKAVEAVVELEWINSPERERDMQADADQLARMRQNRADRLAELATDANRAKLVLMAREAEHKGWGATDEAIAQMQANKLKSARKEWGLA
jgi:hypothetical protein